MAVQVHEGGQHRAAGAVQHLFAVGGEVQAHGGDEAVFQQQVHRLVRGKAGVFQQHARFAPFHIPRPQGPGFWVKKNFSPEKEKSKKKRRKNTGPQIKNPMLCKSVGHCVPAPFPAC